MGVLFCCWLISPFHATSCLFSLQYDNHLISPKEFVHLAGKSTLKDWKRAIRMNGIMLRLDGGQYLNRIPLEWVLRLVYCTPCLEVGFPGIQLLLILNEVPVRVAIHVYEQNTSTLISGIFCFNICYYYSHIRTVCFRKIMDSGELDFYEHTKVCSNTCRSTKIDLTGARVSLTSQTSTEYLPLTPASADGMWFPVLCSFQKLRPKFLNLLSL